MADPSRMMRSSTLTRAQRRQVTGDRKTQRPAPPPGPSPHRHRSATNVTSVQQQQQYATFPRRRKRTQVLDIVKCGYLDRQSKHWRSWAPRWFLLRDAEIMYFKTKPASIQAAIRKSDYCFPLTTIKLEVHPGSRSRPFCFAIMSRIDSARYVFAANSKEDRDNWVNAISHNIQMLLAPPPPPPSTKPRAHPSAADTATLGPGPGPADVLAVPSATDAVHVSDDAKAAYEYSTSIKYPLHHAVFRNNAKLLRHLLDLRADHRERALSREDIEQELRTRRSSSFAPHPEELTKTALLDVNALDLHGNTALHIACMKGYLKCVKVLIHHRASCDIRNEAGWTPLCEAISRGSREIVTLCWRWKRIELRRRALLGLEKLRQLQDFRISVNWNFSSWLPLVSRMCPSDTYHVYKSGTKVRVDTTIAGFKRLSWERGDLSFLVVGEPRTQEQAAEDEAHAESFSAVASSPVDPISNDAMDVSVVNDAGDDITDASLPEETTAPVATDTKETVSETPRSITDIPTPRLLEEYDMDADTKRLLDEFDQVDIMSVALDREAKVFQRLDDDSLKIGDEEMLIHEVNWLMEGELNYMYLPQGMHFAPVMDSSTGRQQEIKVGQYRAKMFTVENASFRVIKRREHMSQEDLKKKKELVTTLRNPNKLKNQLNAFAKEMDVREQQRLAEEKRPNSSSGTGRAPAVDVPPLNTNNIIDPSRPNSNGDSKRQIEVRPSLPPPPATLITEKEYFSPMLKMELEEPPHLGRRVVSKIKQFKFSPTVAICQNFPIDTDEMASLLDLLPQKTPAGMLKDFIGARLPDGFPVQLTLPVFPTITAKVTFEDFEYTQLKSQVFEIPPDFTEDPQRFAFLADMADSAVSTADKAK
jgi:GPCR-chaperone/PH domain/Ankyrin repeats (3 copies)